MYMLLQLYAYRLCVLKAIYSIVYIFYIRHLLYIMC